MLSCDLPASHFVIIVENAYMRMRREEEEEREEEGEDDTTVQITVTLEAVL